MKTPTKHCNDLESKQTTAGDMYWVQSQWRFTRLLILLPLKLCDEEHLAKRSRYVDDMWSILLLENLYLRSKHSKKDKDTCYDEIGLCAQTVDTILYSLVNTRLKGSMWSFIEKESLHFHILNFCISTPSWEIKRMTIFEIHDCLPNKTIPSLI